MAVSDTFRSVRPWFALLLTLLLIPLWQAPAQAAPPVGGSLLDDTVPAEVLAQPVRWQTLQDAPGTGGTIDTAVAATGAPQVWSDTTGADTVVALIDTGVAPIPALEGAVAGEVDFTGTGGGDGYGHGTFMASLVAGRDPRAPGVAPDAGVLSLKVADATGATDLGTVLGALEWLAGPGRALGIEVAVLAAGVPADTPGGEILDLATQRLANLGVLVVTAAGNEGPGNLTSPATSPGTLSVGATDDGGTIDPADDTAAPFSATGVDRVDVPQPDLTAGGVKVVGSIAPDSVIADANPDAMIDEGLFRGSGTSMATALTGGVAALVADAYPGLSGAGIESALVASEGLDAPAALRAGDQHADDAVIIEPEVARNFADAFLDTAHERAEAMATIERDRVADRDAVHAGGRGTPSEARERVIERRLDAIDVRALRAEQKVARTADRDLDKLERRLRHAVVAAPSTEGWSAAEWSGASWIAGDWAASRWQAHDWTPPSGDPVGWESVFAGAYDIPTIHWDPALWGAVQWGAVQWGAVQWGAVQWGADQWEALHWGAVQWGADQWEAVQWGAVRWDAVQWGAVQWGARAWAAVHAETADWTAVQWGAVQWGAVQWGSLDGAIDAWTELAQHTDADWQAVQWGAVQWGAVQWGAVQWGAVQWGAVQWGAVQWGAVQWGLGRSGAG